MSDETMLALGVDKFQVALLAIVIILTAVFVSYSTSKPAAAKQEPTKRAKRKTARSKAPRPKATRPVVTEPQAAEPQPAMTKAVKPKPKRSIELRIDDIPRDGGGVLEDDLKSIIALNPTLQTSIQNLRIRSLVPRAKSSLSATISFRSSLTANEVRDGLREDNHERPYTFTSDFEGFTPLYEDPDGVDVDIIAVPGLGANALGSWKFGSGEDIWLRDFLPNDIRRLRVLVYGYDTTLIGSQSKDSIMDLGQDLLDQLVAFRDDDETSRRPVIFIGHSLGGLLIKEALVRAGHKYKGRKELFEACYGLLFFGVPNFGLRHDQLWAMVDGSPNEKLLHTILADRDTEPSDFLRTLANRFAETCEGKYEVVTFFERKLSVTAQQSPLDDKKWERTGPLSLMVTEASATKVGLGSMAKEDNIALKTDHRGLVKFETRNHGPYTIVKERIKRLVNEAKSEVERRFAEHNLCQSTSKSRYKCMESLSFLDMDRRPKDVEKAAEGTCQWLLGHETLRQWKTQQRSLLWIRGKPGSGKSTLLKYVTSHVPDLYGTETETKTISFFFHGRGHELQKSLLGLFRSLLHQLLRAVPGALADLLDYYSDMVKMEGPYGEKWQWHLEDLQGFLQAALPRVLERFNILFCIDALDECGEEAAGSLVTSMQNMLSTLPPTKENLRIIFSCRHYPIITLDQGFTIILEEENDLDIRAYVSSICKDPDLADMICTQSRGVFMWAQLVVKRVARSIRESVPQGAIKADLRRTPETLEELYQELIKSAPNPSQTLRLIQWICFSLTPLSADQLRWAMAVMPDCTYKTLDECRTSAEFTADGQIVNRIKALSCGLAEVVHSDFSNRVQFIHQSVQDFFIKYGFSTTVQSDDIAPAAHYMLAKSCLHYVRLYIHSGVDRFHPSTGDDKFPLLYYASTSWTYHLELGQQAEAAPVEVFCILQSETFLDKWIETLRDVRPPADGDPDDSMNLLHIVSLHGLVNLITCMIADGADMRTLAAMRDDMGRTPLSYASDSGHVEVVRILLDVVHADADEKDVEDRTPISLASGNGHLQVVKTLLDTGKVDVNPKDRWGRTPLSRASEMGHVEVVKTLLDTGKIDPDEKGGDKGQTPLSLASESGHHKVVKLLLDTGNVDADSRDDDGQTPLLWASTKGHEEVVKVLLATGKVDPDSRGTGGRTPLSLASTTGSLQVVSMLLATGKVDADSKDDTGQTPLSWAAYSGNCEIARALLAVDGVDADSVDYIERTPLAWASAFGQLDMVKMLLDTGRVDASLKPRYGQSPFELAIQRRHRSIVKELLMHSKRTLNLPGPTIGQS